MRRIWMEAATGAWLPHTVGLVITKTSQGPEKWQLCRLLALRRTCGWTEGPEQLSLISLYTMQTSTYSALSGIKRTMMVFQVHSVACRPGVFLWLLCFGGVGEYMFWKGDRRLKWCAFLSKKWDSTWWLRSTSGGNSDFPDAPVSWVQFTGDFCSELAY